MQFDERNMSQMVRFLLTELLSNKINCMFNIILKIQAAKIIEKRKKKKIYWLETKIKIVENICIGNFLNF